MKRVRIARNIKGKIRRISDKKKTSVRQHPLCMCCMWAD